MILGTVWNRLKQILTTRRLEATAHIGSWVAVSLTALMVGSAMAMETNPASAALIKTLGMRGWGMLAALLVSVLFRLIYYYGCRAHAGVVAGVLCLDALGNIYAVGQAGLPKTAHWSEPAITAAVVGLVALLAFVRVSRFRNYVDARTVTTTGLALLLVTAAIAIPSAMTVDGPVGEVRAATTVIEDFEDGNSEFGSGVTATTDKAYEGSHSGEFNELSSNAAIQLNSVPDSSLSVRFYPTSFDATLDPSFTLDDGSGGVGPQIFFDSAGNVVDNSGGSTPCSLSTGSWYKIEFSGLSDISYTTTITASDGTTCSFSDSFEDNPSSLNRLVIKPKDGTPSGYVDFIEVDGASITQTVSGTVTGDDATTLTDANITVNDTSDTTVATTTTASDGSWSVGLADGDYTVEADKPGYVAQTQSVSVSGSAVSGVDFDLAPPEYTLDGYAVGQDTNSGVENATLTVSNSSDATVANLSTNATGYYSTTLENGSYDIGVAADTYDTTTTTNVTIDGAPRQQNISLRPSRWFEMEIAVDAGSSFGEPVTITVVRPDGSVANTELNHNDVAFVDQFVENRAYDIQVVSESGSLYQYNGYRAVKSVDKLTLRPGSDTGALNDSLDVRFQSLQDELDGINVAMSSEDPIKEFDYTVRDQNGTAVYNGSEQFEEPRSYYETTVPGNVTDNASQIEDATLDYSGSYENGTTFNGTTDFDTSAGDAIGPVGSSSSSSGSPVTGIAIVGAGAALAYWRFGNGQLSSAASSAASAVSRKFGGG